MVSVSKIFWVNFHKSNKEQDGVAEVSQKSDIPVSSIGRNVMAPRKWTFQSRAELLLAFNKIMWSANDRLTPFLRINARSLL